MKELAEFMEKILQISIPDYMSNTIKAIQDGDRLILYPRIHSKNYALKLLRNINYIQNLNRVERRK